jgi:hypothetical protein
MLSMLITVFSLLAPVAAPGAPTAVQPGGVTRESFEIIRLGMTQAKVEAIVGCKAQGGYGTGDLMRLGVTDWWDDGPRRLTVNYVFDLSTDYGSRGKVAAARFWDYSSSPPLCFELVEPVIEASPCLSNPFQAR